MQKLIMKPNIERYGNRPDFEAGVVAEHDFEAIGQQKRHSIPWLNPSLQQR
jgi:hypothetical protein